MRKSEDATHFATDGPAPRRYDGRTTAARVRAAVFVRSEKSNALVGDGVPQPAPRSANLDSAFGRDIFSNTKQGSRPQMTCEC